MGLRHVALATALCIVPELPSAQHIGTSRTALATVVDNRGKAVVDIDPDDIVIRDAGQPREVLSIRVADYPVAIVIDNGRGAGEDFDSIRAAAARFVGRIGHRPIAVLVADPPEPIATFEDDREVVMKKLDGLMRSESGDGLFQAVVSAARAIRETGALFSAIVVVSATPISSVPSELLTPILESGARVHVVLNRPSAPGVADGEGPSSETLRTLAEETRGQFTAVFSAASYQVALDRLADRLAPELMVEYELPAGAPMSGDVQLGVRMPGARVNGLGVSPR
jgi:hypothetical protein